MSMNYDSLCCVGTVDVSGKRRRLLVQITLLCLNWLCLEWGPIFLKQQLINCAVCFIGVTILSWLFFHQTKFLLSHCKS